MIDQGSAILSLMQTNLCIFLSPGSNPDFASLTPNLVLKIQYKAQNTCLFTLTPAGILAIPVATQLQFYPYLALDSVSDLFLFIFLAINSESGKIA